MKDTNVKKIQFYKDKSIDVHVKLNNGQFYNGAVLEISADFFLINDRFLGAMPVFFLEIDKIEPYNKIQGKKIKEGIVEDDG